MDPLTSAASPRPPRSPRAWSRWAKTAGAVVLAGSTLAAASCDSSSAGPRPSAGRTTAGIVPAPTAEPTVAPGTLPADRTSPSKAACAVTPRRPGWTVAENKKRGDDGWKRSLDPDTMVNGYLSQVSGACGDTVDLHLSGYISSASVTAYRIGWYDGKGGHVVWSASHVPVANEPVEPVRPPAYTVEASWPTSVGIKITPDWTPGFYLLVVRATSAGKGAAIPFVVRDDGDGNGAPGTGSSPLLFQASVLTYQAYNTFGKYSLYNGPKDLTDKRSDRSRVASFDRPYAGGGYEAPFRYDIPLVSEMEKQGLDADYTTDVDVDQRPSVVPAHRGLVVGGHSEYWTRRMYDAAEYARDHGTNLAFLGANTVYWHTRLEASPSGPDRRMVVYRNADEDPLSKTDPSATTVEWRQPPLNRPETGLVGSDFGSLNTVGGGFRVLQPDSWIFAGTGMGAGRVLKDSLAGEYDMVTPQAPSTPQNIDVIAAAPILWFKQPSMATMSYYTAASGGGVFSGGTTYWACEIDNTCANHPVGAETSAAFATMTDNILRTFAAGPSGRDHPSQRRLAPSGDALISTAASPADVGVRSK